MKDMRINVTDKVAEYQKQDGSIVCGNKDYRLTFDFVVPGEAGGLTLAVPI